MVIINYSPGGLGNFAAQVVTGTVTDPGNSSFHTNFHSGSAYDIQLVPQKTQAEFLHSLAEWRPTRPVAICHSYGAAAELERYTDSRIISIRPVNRWLQLFLNRELKAVHQDVVPPARSYEWYYQAIRWMKIHESYPINHELVNFDNFYSGPELFRRTIQQLNPQADSDQLYHLFNQTQQPIRDLMAELEQLASTNQDIQHRSNLEQAIITWIRQDPWLATVN